MFEVIRIRGIESIMIRSEYKFVIQTNIIVQFTIKKNRLSNCDYFTTQL